MSVRGSDRHWCEYHLDYRLCLLSDSRKDVGVEYRCRGNRAAGAGELLAFEPGDHHVTTRVYGAPANFDVIGIDRLVLERAVESFALHGAFHFKAPHLKCNGLAALLEHLVERAAEGATRLELECIQAEFLAVAVERCTEGHPPLKGRDWVRHAGVRAVRDYLRTCVHEEPRLDDLAKIAGISRFALAHAFKQYIGIPPYAYFQLRRACEARKLIEQGMAIATVAQSLGYSDVPHLSRTLKAHWGVSPGSWRACLGANS